MPSDSGHVALVAIRENILLAQSFIGGLGQDAFADDRKTVYAVIRCLEIISEASRRVSEQVKARHPAIPWDRIAAAGNVYRHDYDNVLETFIWRTVNESLPLLLTVTDLEITDNGRPSSTRDVQA
jgi:uncharacterized protein with HEPN domain